MSTITTHEGVEIFCKDWGPKNAQPMVFHHGWPLSADNWDAQMLYFIDKSCRVIALDRLGHCRSTQVGDGHDMDHAQGLRAVSARDVHHPRRYRQPRSARIHRIMKRFVLALLLGAVPQANAVADGAKAANSRVTLVYQHVLPNVPGKSIKGVLVEYGPGGHSEGHTHPASAFIYATVLEGAIASRVNDGPVKTYRAGQSFSELPGDRHLVSANASKTRPAKLLAVFVVDTKDEKLTMPLQN